MTTLIHNTSLLSRVALRLLLVVSLWQGPVLWGHSHSSALARSESLAAHLAACHACEGDAAQLGWHWHFSIPDSDGTDPSPQKSSRRVAHSVLPGVDSTVVISALVTGISAGQSLAAGLSFDVESLAPAAYGRVLVSHRERGLDRVSRLRC